MNFLKELNKEQREAVEHKNGAALVLAGAGSGKTRVITYRIAHLVDNLGVRPESIIAVTFTNKAATEMKERVYNIVSANLYGLWIGTFHSMCARLMREFSDVIPYQKNYSIYDEQDRMNLIRRVMKEKDVNEKEVSPYYTVRLISNLKNNLIDAEEFEPAGIKQIRTKDIYEEYEKRLLDNDAMDFDDLLFNMYRLIEVNESARKKLNNRFKHKLVDEYQDTNHAQYMILKELSLRFENLFVVGDDDQSIYGFRGADINNILNFEEDFPECKIYKLERNYRSSARILKVASSVVKNNYLRKGKKLWTERDDGRKVTLFSGKSENFEASRLIGFLKEELKNYKKKEILIAYRTNAQSRAIEDELVKNNIEYNIVGGVRFYQRKEIKDILSYIKFILNRNDDVSFMRIINTPRRGIGRTRIKRIENHAETNNISLWKSIKEFSRDDKRLLEFVNLIEYLSGVESVDDLISEIIDRTGYIKVLENEDTVESESRIENILELMSTVRNYVESEEKCSPEDYITEVGLKTDIDEWNIDNSVSLMTLHNTKGLEFPVVFIAGLSEDIIPHYRSIKEGNIEEERRLFYVGITRAMDKVYLSYFNRRGAGWHNRRMLLPSRFLKELSDEDIEELTYQGKSSKNIYRKSKIENGWIEHPIWGRGKILKVVDGDKLLISFNGMTRKIKRRFLE